MTAPTQEAIATIQKALELSLEEVLESGGRFTVENAIKEALAALHSLSMHGVAEALTALDAVKEPEPVGIYLGENDQGDDCIYLFTHTPKKNEKLYTAPPTSEVK